MAPRPTAVLHSLPPPGGARAPRAPGTRRLWAAAVIVVIVSASAFGYRSLGPAPAAARPLARLGAALCQLPEQADGAALIVVDDTPVEVGQALRAELEGRRLALLDGCDVEVQPGDLPEPFGDGAATNLLRLTDSDDGVVVVRVRLQEGRPIRLLGFCALPACTVRVD